MKITSATAQREKIERNFLLVLPVCVTRGFEPTAAP
jgi:hypothetical protein